MSNSETIAIWRARSSGPRGTRESSRCRSAALIGPASPTGAGTARVGARASTYGEPPPGSDGRVRGHWTHVGFAQDVAPVYRDDRRVGADGVRRPPGVDPRLARLQP